MNYLSTVFKKCHSIFPLGDKHGATVEFLEHLFAGPHQRCFIHDLKTAEYPCLKMVWGDYINPMIIFEIACLGINGNFDRFTCGGLDQFPQALHQ